RVRAGQSAPDGPGPPVPAVAGIQPGDAEAGAAPPLGIAGRLRGPPPRPPPERGPRPLSRGRPSPPAVPGPRPARGRPPLGRGPGDVPAGPILESGALGALVRGPGVPVLRVPDRLAPVPRDRRGSLDALAVPGHRPGPRSPRVEEPSVPRPDDGLRVAGG